MHPDHPPRTKRYIILLILTLCGTMAGAIHNRAVDHGKQDPVTVVVRGVVTPPASAFSRITGWFSAQTGWLFHGRSLAGENRRLRDRVAFLEGQNAQLREAGIKYDQLRDDLGFVRKQATPSLAADVLARRPDPKFDMLLISAGSRDGVRQNAIVVTRAGLVGRVTEVTPNTASVLMLTDQTSGAGAVVQRAESRAKGVCKGDNSGMLHLNYLTANADIKPGDVIMTSGLGGVFPAGQVIGSVLSVQTDEGNLNKTALVRPAVDFDRLEQVYVLR
jgi:rod shape-determining protein MreC